ncbi:Alpha-1,3-mannosyl-glycoprotein 2-beta-N-acetylglucosaminyltransferase [Collichthys lucidus]|uniref:Alpha-1,3-mannosyl-glycoprotein 2-beta-N-acetylglucosaminyltransferase n=1 Tax=Collichthys lucidus TaxID=240159 RepID=A0A4U5V3R6_COLLU|nr:Alpha-1,3-mannosyl-glycoprotein 2-beta-N-acetylglucosaminyltransferase [Collichthys lucidus]
MLRKRGSLILCGTFLFITWNAILVLLLWGRPPPGQPGEPGRDKGEVAEGPTNDVVADVLRMADTFEAELERQKNILLQIQNHQSVWDPSNRDKPKVDGPRQPVIPILVIACNRVTVRRCLDKLLQHRPSAELHPIIVSQDCGHAETAEVIRSYGNQVTHLKQPDLSDIAVRPQHKKFQGYYKISRHYRWALNQVFKTLSHTSVVIVEDDLEVAPDFFEYFRALLPLLKSDPNLWCISAWNDNGRDGLGQFYDKYLRYIKLNTKFVPFTKLDLSYLKEETYRKLFEKEVYSAPVVTYEVVKQGQLKGTGPFRLQYSTKDSFKVLAKNLGIMDDLKSGVPRTGYRGVVSFISRGKRVYLAPPPGWTQYDTSWS